MLESLKTFLLSFILPLISLITPITPITVVSITDGDTVKLSTGATIRLQGIDTPELPKPTTPTTLTSLTSLTLPNQCYGPEAKQIASDLLLNKKVQVKIATPAKDRYDRTLAYLFVDGKLINEELVKLGAARYYYYPGGDTTYQAQLIASENEARLAKRGLWSACADPALGSCNVKGNLDNSDQRRYFLLTDRHYAATVVNPTHGDLWFCSEAEATEAGFTHGDQY